MRWGCWVSVACGVALMAAGERASAQGALPPGLFGLTPTEPVAPAPPSSLVMFNGAEADAFTLFGGGGFKWSPEFLQRNGQLSVIVQAGHGWWVDWTHLTLGRAKYVYTTRAAALMGRDFSIAGGSLGIYGGVEYLRESAFDPLLFYLRGFSRAGVRAQIDWWRKFDDVGLLTANISAGTVKRELWARIAYGFAVGSYGYIGPEMSVSASRRDLIWRAGLHWAEIPVWHFKFRIAGGVAYQRGHAGLYAAVSHYIRY